MFALRSDLVVRNHFSEENSYADFRAPRDCARVRLASLAVSVFAGTRQTAPIRTPALADRVAADSGRDVPSACRTSPVLLATTGKIRYDTLKRDSIAFTPAGVFTSRANAVSSPEWPGPL